MFDDAVTPCVARVVIKLSIPQTDEVVLKPVLPRPVSTFRRCRFFRRVQDRHARKCIVRQQLRRFRGRWGCGRRLRSKIPHPLKHLPFRLKCDYPDRRTSADVRQCVVGNVSNVIIWGLCCYIPLYLVTSETTQWERCWQQAAQSACRKRHILNESTFGVHCSTWWDRRASVKLYVWASRSCRLHESHTLYS